MPGLVAAASTLPAAPVLALMALGVVVALAGHLARSSRVVAVGVAILFAATALMLLVGYAAYRDEDPDPRPARPPGESGF